MPLLATMKMHCGFYRLQRRPYFSLVQDQLVCYKYGGGGPYRRLLYFANLLLCSAAILKEE